MPLAEQQIQRIKACRSRARCDLRYLCNFLMSYKDVCEEVHRPVLNFLQPFPDERAGEDRITEKGVVEWVPKERDPLMAFGKDCPKRRILLDPRGFLKTSINTVAHTIQWILNFPDIRILMVHASESQAQETFSEIKEQFTLNSTFRYFFPDYCPHRQVHKWGTQSEFTVPNRKIISGTPTLSCSSIEAVKAGSHYHVIKFFDIVDLQNSRTREQLEKVRYNFLMFHNLLISPDYWIDVEGTTYDFDDAYWSVVNQEAKKPPEARQYQIFVRGAYKKDTKGKPLKFDVDELFMPDLMDEAGQKAPWWPSRWSHARLEALRLQSPALFAGQQLNNPVDLGEHKIFPAKYLKWVPKSDWLKVPVWQIITTVDTAHTINRDSDDTVITTCIWDRMNRALVSDIRLGKFLTDEIIQQIFDVFATWRPGVIRLEEDAFVLGMRGEISRLEAILGVNLPLEFIRRDTRIKKVERITNSLQPWYKGGRLRFSDDLPEHVKERVIREFTLFPSCRHDDILDTLADQFQNRPYMGPEDPRAFRPFSEAEYQKQAFKKWIYGPDLDATWGGENAGFERTGGL